VIRLSGLIAACLAFSAHAGWVRIDWAPSPGVTGIKSGCINPGQYERPLVPIAGTIAGRATIAGLPDSGTCYFELNTGAQDEWEADFSALKFGRAAPGSVENLSITWSPTPPAPTPVQITQISRPYTVGVLTTGQLVYTDRTFTFTTLNALVAGAAYLRTANGDKAGNVDPWLTFMISAAATVYVAYDTRRPLPAWLLAWTDTGQSIVTSDTPRRVYSRLFPAGQVAVGPNGPTTTGSMYSVMVR